MNAQKSASSLLQPLMFLGIGAIDIGISDKRLRGMRVWLNDVIPDMTTPESVPSSVADAENLKNVTNNWSKQVEKGNHQSSIAAKAQT